MANERDQSLQAPRAVPGPELRLLDRRAFVGFPAFDVAPGLQVSDFALQIPDVTFPFNVTGGATRYQKKKLLFGLLELAVDAELVRRNLLALSGKIADLDDLKLFFRPGYLEGQARLVRERVPLTFKIAFDAEGERLAVYLYDFRLYSFSTTPAPQLAARIAEAVAGVGVLPEVEARGVTGFTTRVLPSLVRAAAVGRGYKLPSLDGARLSSAEVSTQGLRLRFSSGGLPPPAASDGELLLALEGARAFSEAERLLASGDFVRAREAYLRYGDAHEAHPFAAERLLTLLVADPQAGDMALDVASSLLRRRPESATALWVEAVIRERMGESARAAERYLALSAHARRAGEESSAFFAAESAARAAREQAPQMAVKALHEVLGLRPDHLPSLRALARAADSANDRAGAIRAYRRIAALAREPQDAAEAHVQMARLTAQTEEDLAGARLHCEAALRLSADHPEALYLLGELCHRAGEHLRALKALDRLRDVALGRHEVDRIGRANLLAGRVWEEGLKQEENALLRYREAASLLPNDAEPVFYAARVAERVGKLGEAVSGYQQALELAGPAPRLDDIRKVAHAANHALARLYKAKLSDPARARDHLEAALSLDGRDTLALAELIPYFRATDRADALADALEKSGAIADDSVTRAALWAEAGELLRTRLSRPEAAERLLRAALESNERNPVALHGLLALAEARRDGPELTRHLRALVDLTTQADERVKLMRRLAVAARDLTFDLDLAVWAFEALLSADPQEGGALGELITLHKRRGDMPALARVLERRAAVAEGQGDKRLASATLRELGELYEARLGRLGEALMCLERASRLSPDPTLLTELADLALRSERPVQARRALEDVLALLPPHASAEKKAEIRARLGRACEAAGDVDAARDHYAQAFVFRKLDEPLSQRLEAIYEAGGQHRELAEHWATRAQALLGTERSAAAAPLLYKSAQALMGLGDRELALARLQAALEVAGDGGEAGDILDKMAELELGRGAKAEAARLWARRAELLADARTAARLLLKAASLAPGTLREAELLDASQQRDPRFAPVRVRQAERFLTSAPERALEELEVVLATPPEDVDAPDNELRDRLLRMAARAAGRSGKLEAARRYLARLAEAHPDAVDLQQELATLHRQAGAREALCDVLGRLWTQLPAAEQPAVLREHAELALSLGRKDEAALSLRTLRSLREQSGWATGALFELLEADADEKHSDASVGRDDERLVLLAALIEQSEGVTAAGWRLRRAQLFTASGQLEAAREDYVQADRLSQVSPVLALDWVELCQRLEDEPGELVAWKRVMPLLVAGESADVHDWLTRGTSRTAGPGAVFGERHRALLDPRQRQTAALSASKRLPSLAKDLAKAGARDASSEALTLALSLALPESAKGALAVELAEVAHELGDTDAAVAALEEASAVGPLAQRIDAHLRRATLLESTGELEGAVAALGAALALDPMHAAASQRQVEALRALERWPELATALSREVARSRPKAEAAALYAELGLLELEKLDRPDDALGALRRAVSLGSERLDVLEALIGLLLGEGLDEEASFRAVDFAAVATPDRGAALLWRVGRELEAHGRGDLAWPLWRKAQTLLPSFVDDAKLAALGSLALEHGTPAEAHALVTERLGRLPDDAAWDVRREFTVSAATLAEKSGDSDEAMRLYRGVLEEEPAHAASAHDLARLLDESDAVGEALDVLWRHAQALPESPATYALLLELVARAEAQDGARHRAVEILRHALVQSPEPATLHRRLVDLLREDDDASPALLEELATLSALTLEEGRVDDALDLYEEEAALAARLGRSDEALRTLSAMRDISVDEGDTAAAGAYERRRAELLSFNDAAYGDIQEALEASFGLSASRLTAQRGVDSANGEKDAPREAVWLERLSALEDDELAKASLALRLASLFEGPLGSLEKAESYARVALQHVPAHPEALGVLERVLDREDRKDAFAAHLEGRAEWAATRDERVALLRRASRLYEESGTGLDPAVTALFAARGLDPENAELTADLADLLHKAGREDEASEFDAVLLEQDPFREPSFSRHVDFLRREEENSELAALLLRRADQQSGREAARSVLEAAQAFDRLGATERARLCEERAFELDPSHDVPFRALRERAKGDVRVLASVLERRAVAVPEEAEALLRERAERLRAAGEELMAAEAFDLLLETVPEDVPALLARADLAAQSGGGPLAAKPYDRKLLALQVDDRTFNAANRRKVLFRVGQASMAQGAFADAAGNFEQVLEMLEGETLGDDKRVREALSLLLEAYTKGTDTHGVYRTTLRMAEHVAADEAEALYRQAAELFSAPADGMDAWVALARLRPSETRVVQKATEALEQAGKTDVLVTVLERHAEAVGGPAAASAYRRAAKLIEARDGQTERALDLLARAELSAPDDADVVRARVEFLRQRGDKPALLGALVRSLELSFDAPVAETAPLRLELARLAAEAGESVRVRWALTPLIENGEETEGYGAAVETLLPHVSADDAPAFWARLMRARADGEVGSARAHTLLESARAFLRAEDFESSLASVRDSLQTQPGREAALLESELHERRGDALAEAESKLRVANWVDASERADWWVSAIDAYLRAGKRDEAFQRIETLGLESADRFPPETLAQWFLALKAPTLAAKWGLPALEAKGAWAELLDLADATRNEGARTLALTQLSDAGNEKAARRLFRENGVFAFGSTPGAALQKLESLGFSALHDEARRDVLARTDVSDAQRREVVDAGLHDVDGAGALRLLDAVVGHRNPHPTLIDAVLAARERLSDANARGDWAQRAAALVPERRTMLLEEAASSLLDAGRVAEAEAVVQQLVHAEPEPSRRSERLAQWGESLRKSAGTVTGAAWSAYASALHDDRSNETARSGLLFGLEPSVEPAELVQRLGVAQELLGVDAVRPHLTLWAETLEKLDRPFEAYVLLQENGDTSSAGLGHRLALAEQLGFLADTIELGEALASSTVEREALLQRALDLELLPHATRLGRRLLGEDALSNANRRRLAQSLLGFEVSRLGTDGVELAQELWRSALRESPYDADGWTSYASVLRRLGRELDAELSDGIGAALSDEKGASVVRTPRLPSSAPELPAPLEGMELEGRGLLPVTAEAMPRLMRSLSTTFEGLGITSPRVYLDPTGGLEARFVDARSLVLGAGALSVLGNGELGFLVTWARLLGARAENLLQPGADIEGFESSLLEALSLYPSSLAACRVMAHLDPRVRGADPSSLSVSRILGDSAAFRRLVQRQLA